MSVIAISLKEQWEQLKAENPKLRIRDAAKQLETSEAQLVALGTGTSATRLEGDWKEFLKEIITLDKVMALTRNDDAVHERKGVYDNIEFHGPVGTVLNPDIDLRLFMMHWAHGYSVAEADRLSFQFFDRSGEAVHKIYCTVGSNEEAFHALTAKYKAAEQTVELQTVAYPPAPAEKPDSEIDAAAFQEGWKSITDTHQFYGLLGKHGVTRSQAMRLAPEGFVKEVDNDITRKMLQAASERQVPIMVFVGNRGCIQIHTGEVKKVMEAGPWYNVMDPDFNLHLRETSIAKSFIVKKPSEDGTITAVEVYDTKGEMIVQFFGKRKPGIPELPEWAQLIQDLTQF
ncbi:hemin-degrading factor [Taibaiella chishuiensis]|uniref:Putative hemin transport protein n=1 Tax=Taibaiella chishuiensis TaxID=1434707 RepID=A0A2P8DAI1_9BACT|nr:ChuX/HutX family heme-like substrate-binding protein [Taibaiella chishuiensis]PSK94230.1 putative hemin transport protein [Taibaiella chishuiensis]